MLIIMLKKIESAFDENPDADVIVFNLIEKNPTRYIIKKRIELRGLII